jgi:MFS family permease
VFLIGNFIALPAFKNDFGVINPATGLMLIETKWQSALQVSGQLGALIGVFVAGPLTSRIGYRWATLTGLMLLNVFIFSMYFAKSLPVMFVSQLLEGIPWGIFIANAPAYCSEIVPIQLRAPATQMLQMFWAIGSIIVGAVTFSYNKHEDPSAYRYVLIHVSCSMYLTNNQQDPNCAPMAFPHSARYPHLSGTRISLVVGSQRTTRRSCEICQTSRTKVGSERARECSHDASCH